MKELKEQLQKINNKWIRLVAWVLVGVNTGALIMGYQLLPFDNEQIVNGVSLVSLYGVELWNHWKNNSYSKPAKEADAYLESRKEQLKKIK